MLLVKTSPNIKGQVNAGGAKNSLQFLVTSALLTSSFVKLHKVPLIRDVYTLQHILQELGFDVFLDEKNECMEILAGRPVKDWKLPFATAGKLRSSLLFIPGLLYHFGKALVPFPGGDRIGERPLDTHFYVLNKFGCDIQKIEQGYLISAKSIKASKLLLPYPSFTGTGMAMMIAATLKGTTLIENAAQEPELKDLAKLLNLMNVTVEGVGTKSIVVTGNPAPCSAEMNIMPDRLEVATFLIAAAITRGELCVEADDLKNLDILISLLIKMGCCFSERNGKVFLVRTDDLLIPQDITTGPYPEFPTDIQPQFMALLTQASGKSKINEKMHTNRFLQVPFLKRMGAEINMSGSNAVISGPNKLVGTNVEAQDIRGGASLLLAALVAKGETCITGQYHLDRGFSNFYSKLKNLGAQIETINEIE